MPIAQRIDFGGIERTRTLAPVLEGVFAAVWASAITSSYVAPEVQLEAFAHALRLFRVIANVVASR